MAFAVRPIVTNAIAMIFFISSPVGGIANLERI
jgi:hypothetical protein